MKLLLFTDYMTVYRKSKSILRESVKLIREFHKISRYKVNLKINFSITLKKSDL